MTLVKKIILKRIPGHEEEDDRLSRVRKHVQAYGGL
jgi:hypothetical protein